MGDRSRIGGESAANRILACLASCHPQLVRSGEVAREVGIADRVLRLHLARLEQLGLVYRDGKRGVGLSPEGVQHPAALPIRQQRFAAQASLEATQDAITGSALAQAQAWAEMARLNRERAIAEKEAYLARSATGRRQLADQEHLANQLLRAGQRAARGRYGADADRLSPAELIQLGRQVMTGEAGPTPIPSGWLPSDARRQIEAMERVRYSLIGAVVEMIRPGAVDEGIRQARARAIAAASAPANRALPPASSRNRSLRRPNWR